jgi:hypothetical protein
MRDERERQQQEYRAIKAWLAGEKPPAHGRTWRRAFVAALPPAVRAVGEQTRLDGRFAVRLVVPLLLMLLSVDGMFPLMEDGSSVFFQWLSSVMPSLLWYGGILTAGFTLLTGALAMVCQGDG